MELPQCFCGELRRTGWGASPSRHCASTCGRSDGPHVWGGNILASAPMGIGLSVRMIAANVPFPCSPYVPYQTLRGKKIDTVHKCKCVL